MGEPARPGLPGWEDLLERLPLPETARMVMAGGQVERVEVRTGGRAWVIWLRLPEVAPAGWLAELEEALRQALPQVPRIMVRPVYRGLVDDLAGIIRLWEQLAAEVGRQRALLGGWLAACRPRVRGEELVLQVGDQVAEEVLRRRGAPGLLEELLRDCLGLQARVRLEVCAALRAAEPETLVVRERAAPAPVVPARKAPAAAPARRRQEGQALYGRAIREQPVPISQVGGEAETLTVQGRILNLEWRSLKSGRLLITFDLTDETDSLSAKLFPGEDPPELAEGMWVLARGNWKEDRWAQEPVLQVTDLCRVEAPRRLDNAPVKRVELHLHTKMSALDGLCDVQAAVEQAACWGHPALAITDHGVVQAFPEAYAAGKRHGVKIIYGLEGYLCDEEKGPLYHVVLLARNQQGLLNLYRLVTLSHLDHFYRKPRLPRQLLQEHREGLLVGSACEAGELVRSLLGDTGRDPVEVAAFYDYLEIQPLANNEFLVREGRLPDREALKDLNRSIVALGERLQKPVVATGDVHFLAPQDAIFRQILQSGQGYEGEVQAPLYYRTTEEMLEEFAYLGEETARRVVVEAPAQVAAQVEEVEPIPDQFYPPEVEGADEEIRELAWSTARARYGDPLPRVVADRLERELAAILGHGFGVLYWIAHKLVQKSNQDGYLVGSRGSVGSCLVATMTGITEVNPLPPHYVCPRCRHSEFITDGSYACGPDLPERDCPRCGTRYQKDGFDIPFETFLGFDGDKVPDIDLNFSGEYQPRAHRYTEELFGKDHVFRAGTIATIAERTAYGFVKNYLAERGLVKRRAEVNRLVQGCTGVKRTTGQHPGGLMVVPRSIDIHRFTPLQRPADDSQSDVITTHFDYNAISHRLVKLDILGHDDPTVIRMLEELTGIDARKIPLDDPATLSLFSGVEALGVSPEAIDSRVGTLGIPEFGTRFVRQMLEETRPRSFADLVRISGFSHGTDVWLNNAQEVIRSGQANLSEAISTRDDIMLDLIRWGLEPLLAFNIMEDVRKGKGLKESYVQAMREKNVPAWYIDSCRKIKYMFPKAHAVAYVTMAFRIAYCKVHHPLAFYASFFTVRAEEFDAQVICGGLPSINRAMAEIERKGAEATARERNLLTILEVAREMYCRGFSFQRVDVARSEAERFLCEGQTLLPPFAALQGVGRAAAESLVRARMVRPFSSVEDLQLRARVSRAVLQVLEEHGALQGLPQSEQMSFFG